jgi:hypothetical protein
MQNNEDLVFLANRARELLDRQVSTFRASHTKASSMLAIIAVFIPVFLYLIEKAPNIIKILAIIPIILFTFALYNMFTVLKAKKLDQGFNEKQFEKLVNEDYENILLYEIGAKRESFIDNQFITNKQNKLLNRGINCISISTLLSIILLVISIFVNPKMETKMSDDKKKEPKEEVQVKPIRVIPPVPSEERSKMNEGTEKSKQKIKEQIILKDKKIVSF